jgi:16S rRNA (guanine966-N2)-methyltransferase
MGPIGNVAPFSLVFADPPYRQTLGERALMSALAGGWLARDAVVVLEEGAGTGLQPVPGLLLDEVRVIGDSQVAFLKRVSDRAG